MVVDHEADVGGASDRQDRFGHAFDVIDGGVLGAQLDQVGAAGAELASDLGRFLPVEVGGVDKGVESAIG